MDVSCDGEDIVAYLERLAPASDTYKHNDLHLRPASEKDRQAIDRNWMSQAGEALVITCDRHSLQTSWRLQLAITGFNFVSTLRLLPGKGTLEEFMAQERVVLSCGCSTFCYLNVPALAVLRSFDF